MFEIIIAKLGIWLAPVITGLGGLLVILLQRWRNNNLKRELGEYKQAEKIQKADKKIDQTIEEKKNEVENFTTDEQLNDAFNQLRNRSR